MTTATTRAALRAGDRAPDAVLDGERLFDLIRGGHFALLCFGTAPVVDGVNVVQVGAVAAATYDAGDRTLILIRPDGYIGFISDAGDAAVSDYLAKL